MISKKIMKGLKMKINADCKSLKRLYHDFGVQVYQHTVVCWKYGGLVYSNMVFLPYTNILWYIVYSCMAKIELRHYSRENSPEIILIWDKYDS